MKKILSRYHLKVIGVILAAVILVAGAGTGGYFLGERKAGGPIAGNKQIDLSTFWEAWNDLNANYYGSINDQARVDGAIRGMVASLKDPYTIYMDPEEDKLFRSDLEGSFSGIGAELTLRDGLLTVDSVLDGSPAQKAGIQSQDVILEINGTKASSLDFIDAIDKIRGDKGTTVDLTVARQGSNQNLKFTVTRDTITVKSVETDTLGDQKDIAYIKINQFGDDTTDLLKAALTSAAQSNKKGIILDLRDNPGGFLTAAADAIGMVIPQSITSDQEKLKERVAVIERDKNGKEDVYKATTDAIVPTTPIVVLVNASSASAAEIFAGAMKDYKRATVVGVKTFGKGSVQNLIKLGNGGSIKVTIAKWFTPLGVGIDGTGIQPDVTVALPANTLPSKTDVQIQKALDILNTSK